MNDSPRGRLLRAAAHLFLTRGYAQTTVRDLAREVGILSGSIFHHFDSKEEILEAVMTEVSMLSARAHERCVRARASSRWMRVRALIRCELESIHGETGEAMTLLATEWRSLSPDAQARVLRVRDRYEAVWQAALVAARSELAPIDEFVLRRLLQGMTAGTANWYRPRGPMSIEALVEHILMLVVRSRDLRAERVSCASRGSSRRQAGMAELQTSVVAGSAEFAANRAFMQEYVGRVNGVQECAVASERKYAERARKDGKLLPRERLACLLDRGAPFLELCPIAGYRMYGDTDGSLAGGNLIAGIGFVSGRRCLAIVWNYAIKGGTITRVTTEKMLRLQEIARQNKLPIVSLSESGGGNLEGAGAGDPWGAVGFLEGGLCYCQQAELSAAGICRWSSRTAMRLRAARTTSRSRITSCWCAVARSCSWPARRCSRPRPARSPASKSSAAPRCTRACRAPANTWPRTMQTEFASRARSWRS